jgi:hypothetical protein
LAIAGSGTRLSFVEYEESYRDKKVKRVRFPSDFHRDHLDDDRYKEINYGYMSPEEIERRYPTTC